MDAACRGLAGSRWVVKLNVAEKAPLRLGQAQDGAGLAGPPEDHALADGRQPR